MSDAIQARILGPLEIDVADTRVEIRGGKQRELLAVLLIHAGDVVSADSIIEALWGESPPPSALKTLQALVSRLRSTLGAASGVLETHGHGYRVRLEPDWLDATAFRVGLEEGRRALARGDASTAAALLRDALALWRGPALVEFRYDDFAQSEIARLDELRLAALEERIEADLELGRHDELVVELEELVAEQPLRERLRGQLMLALYRSGRQAEALSTYQEGRRALAEELGLEPGEGLQRLERRILDHDPEIAAPEPATRPRFVPTTAWRHPRRIAAAGVLVLVAALAAAVFQSTRSGATPEAAGLLALDPDTGELLGSVPLGTAPSDVAAGEGSVWVLDADDRTIARIDPDSRDVVRTFATATTPTDVAVGMGSVWIANGPRTDASSFPESVTRLDPATLRELATIPLRPTPAGHKFGVFAGVSRQNLAVTHDAVWAINPDLTVSRIDPRSNRVVAVVEDVAAENIAAGEGRVWVTEGHRLVEIDESRNTVGRRVSVGDPDEADDSLGGIAVGAGAVWAADPFGGTVWQVSMDLPTEKRAIDVDMWVAELAFGNGAVWATNEIADSVSRIDPRAHRARVVRGAPAPRGVAAGAEGVWVTAARPPSAELALPSPVCGDVVYAGDGAPDVLLVSDLPLRGDTRELTQAMVDGFELVLEQRAYRAGDVSVGYQSCDSSTAQSGGESDFFRCGSNAKSYARNLRVVGVFGSFVSPCSYLQIPITNEAQDGPLVMISPSNTYEGLTSDESLYPTGERSYVRLAANEIHQGSAQVELAVELGSTRAFLLESSFDEYGSDYVPRLRSTAEARDLQIVGSANYDPEAMLHRGVVSEVRRTKPDVVFVVGVLFPGSARLIRELRAALGPQVPIITPDGFGPIDDLVELGGAAVEGLYVTQYGIPNNHLPLRGKQFLADLGRARDGGAGPDYAASYAAQGAEILLDAIARSDGSRRSVTEEVRRTRVTDGVLGNVRFDRNGDLVELPHTALRVEDRQYVVDRVVTVRAGRVAP